MSENSDKNFFRKSLFPKPSPKPIFETKPIKPPPFKNLISKGALKPTSNVTEKDASSEQVNLFYGFTPPSQIYVSLNPTDPHIVPTENQLFFNIGNPADAPVMTLSNPQALSQTKDLPTIDQKNFKYHLSRFYIFFPWGNAPESLATPDEAENIAFSPGPDNTNWLCRQMSSPEVGTYWVLFPKAEVILNPQESISFVIDKLITSATPGMTYLYVQTRDIEGFTDDMHEIPIYKKTPPLNIKSFMASSYSIAAWEKVTLSWNIEGSVDSCVLNPGNKTVAVSGQEELVPGYTKAFTLTAQSGTDVETKQLVVDVNPYKCRVLTANASCGYRNISGNSSNPNASDFSPQTTIKFDQLIVEPQVIGPKPHYSKPPPCFFGPEGYIQLILFNSVTYEIIFNKLYYPPVGPDWWTSAGSLYVDFWAGVTQDIKSREVDKMIIILCGAGLLMNYRQFPTPECYQLLLNYGATLSAWKRISGYTAASFIGNYVFIGKKGLASGKGYEQCKPYNEGEAWSHPNLLASVPEVNVYANMQDFLG